MKTYILTVDEGYGEYVYAVFAESFRDAYERIKSPGYLCMTDDENFSVNDDFIYRDPNHCTFTCIKYGMECNCKLIELKESDKIVFLGGYAE